jgi:hypothetical protein
MLLALTLDLRRVFVAQQLEITNPGEQHEEAAAFVRANPGKAYFPWNTLVTLMADGHNHPFEYGFIDWQNAGVAPPASQIRQSFPPSLAFIIYRNTDPSQEMLQFFPDHGPGQTMGSWIVYPLRPASPESSRNLP